LFFLERNLLVGTKLALCRAGIENTGVAVRYPIVFTALIALTACTAPQTALNEANDMKANIYQTSGEVKDWFLTPPPKNERVPVASTYCYKVFQDILCYRQPMPGYEDRLIAYQGTNAEPPPAAMMQPLSTQESDMSKQPANRVANAQPVFVQIPADVKDTTQDVQDKSQLPAPAADTAHETLPDPALAPQL